ncbi:MAG: response regulator [Planctomycetales bacterium]|nr:response regulator [Planctomycetales bacterium]
MKILFVDDSKVTRAVVSQALLHGPPVDLAFATDGEEAKGLLAGVDLVITDWLMPRTDGVALTRWIRSQPAYRSTPVIMMTGQELDPARLKEARAAGVNLFIAKTFSADDLQRAIGQVLVPPGGERR